VTEVSSDQCQFVTQDNNNCLWQYQSVWHRSIWTKPNL